MSRSVCSCRRCPSLPLLLACATLYVFLLAPGQASWLCSPPTPVDSVTYIAGSHPSLWHIVIQPLRLSSACVLHQGLEEGVYICVDTPSGGTTGKESLLSELHITSRVRAHPLTILGKGVSSAPSSPLEEEVPNVGTFSPSRWEFSRKLGLTSMGGSAISLILTWSQCPLLSWAFPPIPAPSEPHLMLWKAKAPVLPERLYPRVLVND